MFILGQFFNSLALLFNMLFTIIYFLLVVRIIISWLRVDPYNELVQTLYRITDPILAPFRKLPLQIGMIDLSPVVAFILLSFVNSLVVGILKQLALRFS